MPEARPHERFAARLSRTPSPNGDPDAGMRGVSHYERRLRGWRFRLRNKLIPIVRWETPYLAYMQKTLRSPWLDTYFALTANLGTHTFFMTAIPICFWCSYPDVGLAMVHMLALGVYLSGFVKDMVCLPRPLSPPLQRITMSGSAAMEYGFPSTHTTNAVSVALFCLYRLYIHQEHYTSTSYSMLQVALYGYAISIAFGRMYCGMHGFFDVIIGAALGAAIASVQILYGAAYDNWLIAGGWQQVAILVAILAVAVRIHPEPADNCPCFDDSVAFAGVVMGAAIATWHYGVMNAHITTEHAAMYAFDSSPIKIAARIVGGIVIVFLWRAATKPILLRGLPPVFRFVDRWGLALPRRYFLQARQYQRVPPLREDDNVLPSPSSLPALFSNLRQRKRAVSIGPQSEADAREFIANRAQKRRDSRAGLKSEQNAQRRVQRKTAALPSPAVEDIENGTIADNSSPETTSYLSAGTQARVGQQHLQVNGVDAALLTPPLSDAGASSDSGKEDEKNDKDMFSGLEKPRIRYDVEVITKIVVYAGIGWWAIEGNPLWFRAVGIA
ncbi:Long-chain base-1-phosphate phosphatase [Recurvomyces mirabilis]|uniref:Long-chain base-1-phosphate phosphatase n=1 Tax=Recurvomyces mirabilis TaxID=574656 RepID=A0AAE0WU91_9PEZI|nr:Long-chain base-1-phosphate phosphatase [Recurvomyces mirabilis]KAK5160490.1 Long-chain base-1-phosphate phosphatase [Recurvomyces mirabilis]